MIDATPSRTAARVARRRAVHQLLDSPPVLDDPLAVRVAGIDAATFTVDAGEQQPVARALRAFLAARSRFAEDHLDAAIGRGARQYVILGAGLDTFAYRHPYGEALRVFEVDFPATQSWKRHRLADAGVPIPPGVAFVPVDFERQSALDVLRVHGFDPGNAAYFSWLGVTMYLTEAVVMAVLGQIAAMPPGSGVAFDYAVDPASLDETARRVAAGFAQRAAAAGEPWTLSFEPDRLVEQVRGLGFTQVENLGSAEINSRYFADRSDGLRVGSVARLLHAAV